MSSLKLLIQLDIFFTPLWLVKISSRIIFSDAVNRSFLYGSLIKINLFKISLTFSFSILFWSIISLKSFIKFIISFTESFLASYLDFFIWFLTLCSIWSNSFFSAILFSNIHSFIFLIQSYSFSQSSLSFVLYLSCDPDVECPRGWVNSCTWISTGICFSLQIFSAFS